MENFSYEIIVFGGLAVLLAIKLYSVLGKNPSLPKVNLNKRVATPSENNKIGLNSNLIKNDKYLNLKILDPKFDENSFLKGAKDALIMIFKAFAEKDYIVLKNLLDYDLYDSFIKAIGQRPTNYQPVLIKNIKKATVIEHTLSGSVATISVKFEYTQTSAGKDYIGSDIWLFSRNLASSNPNWQVIETKNA